MDDQREDHIDPEGQLQGNSHKKLQAHNLPTDDVENINSTNKKAIYYSLTSCGLFPEEKNGCRKESRVMRELLYIDQYILNESKTRRKNLAMTDKKAHMFPTKLDNKLPQNVQSIRWSHKLYRENYEIPVSGIDCWRAMFSWSKGPKRYISRRYTFMLLFIIAIMLLNHILRNCTAGYKFCRSQEKINHLMWYQTICKKWKRTGN